MVNVGKWRWPLAFGLSLVVGSVLFWRGLVGFNYQGQAYLVYSGHSKQIEVDPKIFQTHRGEKITFEKVAAQPRQISMRSEGKSPDDVAEHLQAVGRIWSEQSVTKQKMELKKVQTGYQKQIADLEAAYHQLSQIRKALLSGPRRNTPRATLVARIEELKARRNSLIEHYPTHTDIPILAKQIQDLLKEMGSRPAPLAEKITDLDRQINETKVRKDYFSRRLKDAEQAGQTVTPYWKIVQPIRKPMWPNRVEGWPIGAGSMVGVFVLAILVFKGRDKSSVAVSSNGLWKPESVEKPVDLQVVSPEPALPSDPLTEKASILYKKWVEVAKVLYAPAPEPPQGVLDLVGPLLQESSDFLPEGHDVLAKYLARSVTPGDLAAHVARTVLMTLTGAQEAGVSPEHRLAMALAALFHDLAIVPRPAGQQDDVGSEVGRLSATVLRRIPGLQPALLSMVEDILIGMDEFKLETWQNVASGNHLEPLSKVLREIDRFEKVMQKQKSRLDRRVANS